MEGVIKFSFTLLDGNPPEPGIVNSLEKIRKELYARGFIGVDESGLGYGNLSMLHPQSGNIVISGSQTGNLPELNPDKYAIITAYSFDSFHVTATGKSDPSSETLTHAAIYETLSDIRFIIHIHSKKLWDYMLQNDYPASHDVEYGSREMADEIKKMNQKNLFLKNSIFAMKGHEAGIISFGKTGDAALQLILNLARDAGL